MGAEAGAPCSLPTWLERHVASQEDGVAVSRPGVSTVDLGVNSRGGSGVPCLVSWGSPPPLRGDPSTPRLLLVRTGSRWPAWSSVAPERAS
jgi:hypothetical protein